MSKRVILITGTPCVGKTSAARLLEAQLDALYINLTDLALRDHLTSGRDEIRDTVIVNESKMKRRTRELIQKTDKENVVVDGHYAVNVVPKNLVTLVFVLRRDPVELREFMRRRGFSEPKTMENLASEILDVCLVDAINTVGDERTCELDVTGKTWEQIVGAMLEAISDSNKCHVGVVDWLGKLEKEGRLDEFLRI